MDVLIRQRSLVKGMTRTLFLKGRDDLVVSTATPTTRREQTFRLEELNPDPVRYRALHPAWTFAAVVLGLVTAVFLAGTRDLNPEDGPLFAMAAILAVPTAVAIAKSVAHSREVLIYTQVQTHRWLFLLDASIPNRAAVDGVVAALAGHIGAVRYPRDLSDAERLDHYRRHVEFLHHEGVVSAIERVMILDRLERRAAEAQGDRVGAPVVLAN